MDREEHPSGFWAGQWLNRKTARTVLLATAALWLLALPLLPSVYFSYDLEQYFPQPDDDLSFYQDFNTRFQTGNDYLSIGISRPAGIYDTAFLRKVDELARILEQLPHVVSVYSPTQASLLVNGPFGLIGIPYLHPKEVDRLAGDSTRIAQSPEVLHTLFAADGKAVAIHLELIPGIGPNAGADLLNLIEQHLAARAFEETHVIGQLEGERAVARYLESEMQGIAVIATVLILGLLLLLFRSWRSALIPLLVVISALLIVFALMSLFGKPVNLFTALLPIILLVIGLSGTVHLFEQYRHARRSGQSHEAAIRSAIQLAGRATFLTAITTAIGFFTLINSNILPVRDLGWLAAAGVILAFAFALFLLPALLLLLRPPRIAVQLDSPEQKRTARLTEFQQGYKKPIVLGFVVVLGLTGWLTAHLSTNNYFQDEWPKSHPHRQAYDFFENHFAGHRPFELAFWVTDSTHQILSLECLQEIERIEQFLAQELELRATSSPVTFIKLVNKGLHGGVTDYYTLPKSEAEFDALMTAFARLPKSSMYGILTKDHRMGRITGKMVDGGSVVMEEKRQALQDFLEQDVDTAKLQWRITGIGYLSDKNSERIASTLLVNLLIAIGMISLLMGFLFKSVRMTGLVMLCNLAPLLGVAALMNVAQIPLNTTTAVIFTIAFGIAVDDTIHFLSRFRLEIQRGQSVPEAIQTTLQTTGRAIVMTSLMLCAGFGMLLFASLNSGFYFGLLLVVALILAVIIDLLVLPALLLLTVRDR